MCPAAATNDPRTTWELAAPGWARWEHAYDAGFAEATAALLDMAGVGPGMRVLDIACGAGGQTLMAARRAGPAGRVVATDIAPTMLAHVRASAAAAGLDTVETVEGAADDLAQRLGPQVRPFDAAVCRMAPMHFPAPGRALAVVRSLLVLDRLLRESGFRDVEVRTIPATLHFADADAALAMLREAAGAYRAVAATLDEAARARAWDEVRAGLRRHETGAGFDAALEVIVGAGSA